jgi:hypothetical protein
MQLWPEVKWLKPQANKELKPLGINLGILPVLLTLLVIRM